MKLIAEHVPTPVATRQGIIKTLGLAMMKAVLLIVVIGIAIALVAMFQPARP